MRVLKFGGSSLGDADCIGRAARLVAASSRRGPSVVVASAMGGVTDSLVEAARRSEIGDAEAHVTLAASLRRRHEAVLRALPAPAEVRHGVAAEMEQIIEAAAALCRVGAARRELTPSSLDALLSAGEGLSTRLVGCALWPSGVVVEATGLVVTDGAFGRAAPLMPETRERVRARLLPLTAEGFVPVVAGFVGATERGETTTLGRGGSDYTATILGAALDATEITVWTDVDGVLSADPRLVPEAGVLPEISHGEAAELVRFGVKRFHPQTFRPLAGRATPVRVRNSFAPGREGTTITGSGGRSDGAVKVVVAVNDFRLISAADGAHLSSSSLPNEIRFAAETLLPEFASRGATYSVSLISVVGEGVWETPGMAARMTDALRRHDISVIALARGPSGHSISVAVEPREVGRAAAAIHRELGLRRRDHEGAGAREAGVAGAGGVDFA